MKRQREESWNLSNKRSDKQDQKDKSCKQQKSPENADANYFIAAKYQNIRSASGSSESSQKKHFASSDKSTPEKLPQMTVNPITLHDKDFPYFRKPNEIGCFSQDIQRRFRDDPSQLKVYCPPVDKESLHLDLRKGYKTYDKRDEAVKEYLDDLLQWIHLHRGVFSVQGQDPSSSLSTDFISWRGLITKLLCTPYENRDGWRIGVTLSNGTWYMCEFDTAQKLQQKVTESERMKEMTYWGVKFEQYVTAENLEKGPVTDIPVNNKEAYGSVVRTRINKHSLVYGGEIDCYVTENGKKKYIELKTSREIEHPRQLANFKRFKAIKWWAQSFLVGIEKIVCGFRDDDGVISRLEDFATMSLPKYCQDIPNCWQPNICFNFLDSFLQHVKDVVKSDNPRVVYMFSWNPREPVRCSKYPENSEFCFLPEWFTQKE